MDDFKLTAGIEFKDPYENAKSDVLKALESVRKLTESQRRQLAKELFGVGMVAMLWQAMCNRM